MNLNTGIISYWKCDEASGNAADSFASNTLTNNGTTPYATAKLNNGFDFGAANSTKWFSNTATRIYAGGAFTYSFWINVRTAPSLATTNTLFVANDGTTFNFAFMEYRNNAGTLQVAQGKSRFGVANDEVVTTKTLTIGTFYHLCCTYDGTTITSYIDSVSQGTVGSSGNGVGGLANEVSVGRYLSGTNYTMAYVDEIGFWNRALNQTEVWQLYNSSLAMGFPLASQLSMTGAN